jgi:hypothetical protein
LRRTAIGSEYVPKITHDKTSSNRYEKLSNVLRQIAQRSQKASLIVGNFFSNMEAVFTAFQKVLRKSGHLCFITGNNTICEVPVDTHEIIIEIADKAGFYSVDLYRDQIRNRRLPPKRNHQGGVIREEWVNVFKKKESQAEERVTTSPGIRGIQRDVDK